MKITLSPIAGNKTTQISISGETLTYDGETIDMSPILDGQQVKAELPAIGLIKRVNGEIEITVQYFYDSKLAEPNQSKDISDYTFTVTSGDCPCPIKWKPEPVIEELPEIEPETEEVTDV